MNTPPQTADQINLPQTGQATVTTFPPTVNITSEVKKQTTGWPGGMIKDTRENVLKLIAESSLTDARKAVLVEDVGMVSSEHNLIQVHFHWHKYNAGGNGTWTVDKV